MGGHGLASAILSAGHLQQLPLFLSDARVRLGGGGRVKVQPKNEQKWTCYANTSKSRQQMANNQRFSTFSLGFDSHVPLRDSPGAASFDEYLKDQHRLMKTIFPGKCKNLKQDDWRVEIPPIELLFLKFFPIIDMQLKCKGKGQNYPCSSIVNVVELDMIRWEIKGLDSGYMPNSLDVTIRGAVYSEQKGLQSWLRNQLVMSVTFEGPDSLAYIPKDVIQSLIETVLKKTVDDLRNQVNNNLLWDYSKFKREKQQSPPK